MGWFENLIDRPLNSQVWLVNHPEEESVVIDHVLQNNLWMKHKELLSIQCSNVAVR